MKYLITGSGGFIGFHLSKELLKNKKNFVYGIDNLDNYYSTKLKRKRIFHLKKYRNFLNIKVDLSNEKSMKKLKKYNFDIVFHLAAQAIVSKSFNDPYTTWKSNTFGILNILETLRFVKKKTYVVLITSDKSYKNVEVNRGYKEEDVLGGDDPYSASKRSAEILINSYVKSFFDKKKLIHL